MNRYFELIQNIISFANRDERIAALIMIGSQARETKSADEFSDLDLILITSDTNWLVNSNDWVSKIGKHYITFVEKTIVSADEKRVMFEGALDVDFVIVSKDDAKRVLASKVALEIFQNGYKILVDKTDIKAVIPNSIPLKPYVLPSEEIYINVVNDF
jgi:Streptomycin adenylyltransferase.